MYFFEQYVRAIAHFKKVSWINKSVLEITGFDIHFGKWHHKDCFLNIYYTTFNTSIGLSDCQIYGTFYKKVFSDIIGQ